MQQVCMEYMYKRETYHLACYYMDAYLNLKPANKENLQLIGIVAIQIATKMEVSFFQFNFRKSFLPPFVDSENARITLILINKWMKSKSISFDHWISNWIPKLKMYGAITFWFNGILLWQTTLPIFESEPLFISRSHQRHLIWLSENFSKCLNSLCWIYRPSNFPWKFKWAPLFISQQVIWQFFNERKEFWRVWYPNHFE